MKKFLVVFMFGIHLGYSQPDLTYFLPADIHYNKNIPTPATVIGYDVGERLVNYDELVAYMHAVANKSDRVSIKVTGYTHERRPLVLVTITSAENQKNLEEIRIQHLKLTDPIISDKVNITNMPAIFYIGCSIHGNEASGSNAALLFLYYLAAAEDSRVEKLLTNTVILLDPSQNPDGMQRFVTWINSQKSQIPSADRNDLIHHEPWPSGRTNHYWFDLNRDWLAVTQPESQARLKSFHHWKPNLLTDHHEMLTNSTFYFQPGVVAGKNPLTPMRNIELTKQMGEYHARALDSIGSRYSTKEAFDDYYVGKGSTYPDLQGAVGILFEQASAAGFVQESENGLISFPFAIRNQLVTALSSLKSVTDLRVELLNYQREFYQHAINAADADTIKGYIFGTHEDATIVKKLADILQQHEIEVYNIKKDVIVKGKVFYPKNSLVVPLNQKQYVLIKSLFEFNTNFTDSTFYDISTWTLPALAGLDFESLQTLPQLTKGFTEQTGERKSFKPGNDVLYTFSTSGYYYHRAINRLLSKGVTIKVCRKTLHTKEGIPIKPGSVMISTKEQQAPRSTIDSILIHINNEDYLRVTRVEVTKKQQTQYNDGDTFLTLQEPVIALLTGDGINANAAGEIWHLLDHEFQTSVSRITTSTVNGSDLSRYNTIIFPSAVYGGINAQGRQRLKSWVENGGTIIALESALAWMNVSGVAKFDLTQYLADTIAQKGNGKIGASKGSQAAGIICKAVVNRTHPLLCGYTSDSIFVFKNNHLAMQSTNAYQTPVVLTSNPVVSGYVSPENRVLLRNSSFVQINNVGKGVVIGFTDDITFRGFCFGTDRLLLNAIFLSALMKEKIQ